MKLRERERETARRGVTASVVYWLREGEGVCVCLLVRLAGGVVRCCLLVFARVETFLASDVSHFAGSLLYL